VVSDSEFILSKSNISKIKVKLVKYLAIVEKF